LNGFEPGSRSPTDTSDVNSDRAAHPVVYRGILVAIAGRERCHVLVDLGEEDLRVVLAMCLYNREIEEGRAPGPYRSEAALRWAALVLRRDAAD
jgi:hypothetical protein